MIEKFLKTLILEFPLYFRCNTIKENFRRFVRLLGVLFIDLLVVCSILSTIEILWFLLMSKGAGSMHIIFESSQENNLENFKFTGGFIVGIMIVYIVKILLSCILIFDKGQSEKAQSFFDMKRLLKTWKTLVLFFVPILLGLVIGSSFDPLSYYDNIGALNEK